jgi:iron complex transport system substrate-binding protein
VYPQRVICLTAETTELAFALGCADRVVGVSGYAVRPPEARKKPRVAAFQTAHVDRILALQPDLVLGFSDIQADITAELVRQGANVLITNQRTLAETAAAMQVVAGALGLGEAGERLVAGWQRDLREISDSVTGKARPIVYFEEWDDPLISGIAWASELIEIAGGSDAFPELRGAGKAMERVVQPEEVVRRAPDIVVASWCGKKARLERIVARPGWDEAPAVRTGSLYEIKAPDILQPGLSLLHGARQLRSIVQRWNENEGA